MSLTIVKELPPEPKPAAASWHIAFKDGERIELAFDEAAREVVGALFVPGLAPLTVRGPGQWEVLQALIALDKARTPAAAESNTDASAPAKDHGK